jgi:hypothetical protein
MLETRTSWCSGAGRSTPCFCYTTQVDWSAYREPSFGYGILTFESATAATWTWCAQPVLRGREGRPAHSERSRACMRGDGGEAAAPG